MTLLTTLYLLEIWLLTLQIISYRYGTPPHGRLGVGLEHVVMLFCVINILKVLPRMMRRMIRRHFGTRVPRSGGAYPKSNQHGDLVYVVVSVQFVVWIVHCSFEFYRGCNINSLIPTPF